MYWICLSARRRSRAGLRWGASGRWRNWWARQYFWLRRLLLLLRARRLWWMVVSWLGGFEGPVDFADRLQLLPSRDGSCGAGFYPAGRFSIIGNRPLTARTMSQEGRLELGPQYKILPCNFSQLLTLTPHTHGAVCRVEWRFMTVAGRLRSYAPWNSSRLLTVTARNGAVTLGSWALSHFFFCWPRTPCSRAEPLLTWRSASLSRSSIPRSA